MNKEITEKSIQNYDILLSEIELYTKLQVPICIYGEIGKTRFLKSIIKDLIIIDSREISDIRNLSGFYAIDNGEITYVEGILITAMIKGLNILFKNIDQNYNLFYFLNSVIKQRKVVNNKGEQICAENTFNLLFTAKDKFMTKGLYFVGPINYTWSGLFDYSRNFNIILDKVISLLNENAMTKCDHKINKDCYKTCMSGDLNCFDGVTICLSKKRSLCSFHYKKVFQLHESLNAKNLNSHETRLFLYDNVTNLLLNHDSEELLSIFNLNYYPDVVIYALNIVKTYAYRLAIRNLVNNIKMNKYSLLLGETGVGKTSVIQYICRNSQNYFDYTASLKIVNMSPDYDVYDLIGGYGSLDLEKRISDLYNKHLISKPKIFDNSLLLKYLKERIDDSEIDFLDKCIKNKTAFVWKDGILLDAMKKGYWILLDEINLCSEETLNMIDSLISKNEIINYERDMSEKFTIHKNFMLFACMNPGNDYGKKNFVSNNFNYITFYDFTDNISDIKLVIKNYVSNILDDKTIENISTFFYELKQMIRRKELTNKIEPLISGRTLIRCLEAVKNHRNVKISDIFSVFVLTQFDIQSRSLVYSKLCNIFESVENKIVPTFQDGEYILTPKTQLLMYDINSSILLNCPILLQGDTSTGKTSIIFYLANKQNHKVIRFNNHEHTEAADYLGNYITTTIGIEFKESIFIKAIRNGWWVILDELNLAQSDVLEVLNRLLDDNKEIYLPQKDEVIKAHPNFRLFATQNIEYGGRKGISKAFRNRFVEIFFAEKTETEILEILHLKTGLPKSFCLKMVQIYNKLKNQRNIDCLVTLRDLFKWAKRIPRTMFEVYETGLSIIYEKQRTTEDKIKVLDIFKTVFTKLDNYKFEYSNNENFILENDFISNFSKSIVLTPSIVKVIKLLNAAIRSREPILLIGETGIGKTKICEIFSKMLRRNFIFINMHSGIESSDFTGNFTLEKAEIKWRNGPLIEAMENGSCFLIDEINLAEDAVLERLNSLLEDNREIFITEIDRKFKAHDDFIIFATMNPGNDFGKRELSPALRNRFTEIYYDLPNEEIYHIFDVMLIKRKIQKPIFYDAMLRSVCSLRNFELFCEFFQCAQKDIDGIIQITNFISPEEIAKEAYSLAFNCNSFSQDCIFEDSLNVLSVSPFYIKKKGLTNFEFGNKTTLRNLKKIMRALVVKKGIMLEGEPGVGKTSIVTSLSKLVGKKCIRINLSEQTELSDLVGSYLPIENGIKFVPSQLAIGLELGWWIILDEINLCSQSVIEGLNSVLDYRRMLVLPECTIVVHPETKIFATMNPFNNLNGRKILPKSFMDRFVTIYMEEYTEDDIRKILEKLFCSYKFYENCSLRENINRNICPFSKGSVEYKIDSRNCNIGNVIIPLSGDITTSIDCDFVLLHSQINQIEMICSAITNKIPVIITGGFGKGSLIGFLSKIFSIPYFDFMCHKDIDTSDLLGQYHKSEEGTFVWKNSLFIESMINGSLIVLHNPELVEKSILDRCNSLFENERFINIYEKGIDTDIIVNDLTRFILLVDNIIELSPALRDRCLVVELSNELTYIDIWKIFYKNKEIYDERESSKMIDFKKQKLADINFNEWVTNEVIQNNDLDILHRKFNMFSEVPNILNRKMTNVYNEIIEEKIEEMFKFTKIDFHFDEEKLKFIEFYKSINYDIKSGNNDIEKIMNIKNVSCKSEDVKAITFIKNLNLDILDIESNTGNFCLLDIPTSFQSLKEGLLFSLQSKTLNDIPRLKEIFNLCSESSLNFTTNFNREYFKMLHNLRCDPLESYKEYITYDKHSKENELLKNIYENIKLIYKYGRVEITDLVKRLEDLNLKYYSDITKINDKLDRNFEDFKGKFCNVDLCGYLSDKKTQEFFSKFDDVFDYFLIYLFELRKNSKWCQGICKGIHKTVESDYSSYLDDLYKFENNKEENKKEDKEVSYKNIVANMLTNKYYTSNFKDMEYGEFGVYLCKFVYSINNNKCLDISNLILESCLNKNIIFNHLEKIDTSLDLPEIYINECLKDVFKVKEVSYILDSRNNTLYFTKDFVKVLGVLGDFPIFTKPDILYEKILEYLKNNKMHKTLSDNVLSLENVEKGISEFIIEEDKLYKNMNYAYKIITKYFKNPESVHWPTNYRYYVFLEIHKFTIELAERFFLDSQVYEFYDRMKFAESKALNEKSNFFYNLVLQYKAFEIDSRVNNSLKEAQNKLRKEPKLFEKIREELINFVTLPVTNILDLKFNKPQCCCEGLNLDPILYKFVQSGDKCICEKFNILSDDFNRLVINGIIEGLMAQNYVTTCNKEDIINYFYNRTVTDKFSYSEICLSKVINKITEDPSHLKLIQIAIRNPFPPFLYFIFNFADEDTTEYEDGTGIKGGTGEKNISDKIEEEDEISEEYCDKNDVEEDDGIDLDNEGSMSTVEEPEDEKNEVGVDGNDDSEESNNEEEKNEEEKEDKVEFEENEGFGESSEDGENGMDEVNEEGSSTSENDQVDDQVLNNQIEDQILEEKNDAVTEYKYKEGKLNQNQTCDEAIDYDRKVYGENIDEALCPGEGAEEIEGNQDKGDNMVSDHVISISYKESYSDKLVLMLRNILESNKHNKYKGDYKSGKKLNMKRLIPYIASDYRRDKIWMKRRRSDKKDYIIRLFIDNSRSMYSQEMINTLLTLFSRLTNSFKALNIPVKVYRFGNELEECEIKQMNFSDNETNIDWIEDYKDGINIVLTDGVFQKTGFYNKNFLIILIDKNDIINMSKVSVTEENIFIQKYLELFSLKYCIIKNIEELESTFILALSELIKNY